LSLFGFRFHDLVASPVETLAYNAIPVALIQIIYSATCIQPAMTAVKGSKSKKKGKGKPGAPGVKKDDGPTLGEALVPVAFVSLRHSFVLTDANFTQRTVTALILSLLSTLLLFILAILMGAPATTHTLHTLVFALHVSLLALYPLFYARPLSARHWLEILSGTAPFDEVYGAALGTLAGAWLGAIPIPLDWDRDWQKWPVTVVCGAYGGWFLGKSVGRLVAGSWRGNWK
jgi:phosphatidylinositol glycan class F